MRITIDTHAATPAEMGICIATLQACGADMPKLPQAPSDAEVLRMMDGTAFSFDEHAGSLLGLAGLEHTDKIAKLIGLLNDELYSRRIPAPDNPASGADAAALNSDAADLPMLMTQHGEIVKGDATRALDVAAGVDLAAVFGGGHPADVLEKITGQPCPPELRAICDETVNTSGIQLDKAGIPWDSRIHSASKSINQTDGLWRQKRGVSPDLVATVVGQLKQAQSVPGVAREEQPDGTVTDVDPTDTGVGAISTINDLASEVAQTARIIPPPPPRKTHMFDPSAGNSERSDKVDAFGDKTGPGGAAPPADTGEIDSLPRLLKFITEQKLAGKINQAQVQQALIALGIEGPLPVLQSRPDLIPEMVKKLRAIGGL
jgi:hypothetical protein